MRFQLTIKRVVHAYLDLYGNLDRSLDCNNNIACFPVWSKESDAVALVLLSNGAELCSGSLLMTANLSFRPYFLSAFHCIDTDLPNGSLSSSEISNAKGHMFIAKYEDVPGSIGKIGTKLGKHDVNIGIMQVGRDKKGGRAIMILTLDKEVPNDVVKEIQNLDNVYEAIRLEL